VVFDQVGRSRVVAMTPSDFQDISAIRVALESAAASEAAVRFTESLRAILESNIDSMLAARSLAEVTRLDLEFHTSVMESSGRRPLITTWRSIQSQLALWLGSLHRTREAVAADVLTQTIEAHRSLVYVLASGDSARSAAAFSEHAAGLVRWVTDVGGRVP
jgi:DNA-binding FadR family transcriptional regulator